MQHTKVSYIAGIGKKPFIADFGQELPNANPVTYSDTQFARYAARKAAFMQMLDLMKKPDEIKWLAIHLMPTGGPDKRKELEEYLTYAFGLKYTNEDAHHYAISPNNPGKYSKRGTLNIIAQSIFKTLQKRDKLDGIFAAVQDMFENLQTNKDGKGATYFLYLFLPPEVAAQIPAIDKKRKAQANTLKLLQEGLGVMEEDLKTLVRRLTRRNLLKEPERVINEMAKKRIIVEPTDWSSISPVQTAGQGRGNAQIGEPVTLVVAIIGLVATIIAATGAIIDNNQKQKLIQAQNSIKQENIPDSNDFPATMLPINNPPTAPPAGGFLQDIKTEYLIAAALGLYLISE
jgi:hypothetical protein